PGVFVVASCEIAGEYREYERASTTSIDAYLGPVVRGYLRSLRTAARRRGLPAPALMQSSGGLAAVAEAAAHPARLRLSGRGGEEPTVTDANLVLGRLDPDVALAGSVRLDVAAARRVLRPLTAGFRSLRAAAEGVVAVANQEMVRAIRVVSVERGHDPRVL